MLLAATACNKEIQGDNPTPEAKPQVELSFNASLTVPTRTEIGVVGDKVDGVAEHQIYWSKGDKIAVYPHDPNSTTGVAGVEFTSEDLVETSAAEAVFTGEIDAADAYYAFYPTTAGAKWHGGAYSDFSVTLPYEQTANGIASGFAVANVTGTETVTFDHVCGFVKFTIDETYAGMIKEVRFSGKNSESLAGKLFVYPDDMSRNEINSSQQTVLTLSPSAGETFAAGTYYFTCFPVNLTGGLELTFVNTDDEEAVKSSAAEANIERAGVLNLGTVANLEFESVAPILADGTYVILAKKDEVYYAMGSDKYGTSSRLNESVFDYAATETHDETLIWTITTQNNKFTISSSNSKYLSAGTSSGKYTLLEVTLENPAPVLTFKNGSSKDSYIIESVVSGTTYTLARNDSAHGFAFYSSTQNNNLYLKPITYVEMPELQAPVISVTGNNEDKTVTVTWNDVENATSYEIVCGDQSETVDAGIQTCTFTMTEYGTYEVTVTAKAEGCISATSDSTSVTLKDPDDNTAWVRVTSVDQLLAGGTFIIGYEATAKSGIIVPLRSDGANATTTAQGYLYSGTTAGASNSTTIDMGNVGTTSQYEVTITASGVSGAIDIKLQESYIGNPSSSSGGKAKLYSTVSDNTSYTPTIGENDVVTLTSVVETTKDEETFKYVLQYNTSSPRFSNYKSTNKNLVCYKKTSL